MLLLAEIFMYNIGCFSGNSRWSYGPKIGAVFQFDTRRDEPWHRKNGMNYRRWGNSAESGPRWEAAAWHLTNFMTPWDFSRKLEGFFHFKQFSRADREPRRLAKLMTQCKTPYPDKYKRMRMRRPVLGSPFEDALAYIHDHYPALRAHYNYTASLRHGERPGPAAASLSRTPTARRGQKWARDAGGADS